MVGVEVVGVGVVGAEMVEVGVLTDAIISLPAAQKAVALDIVLFFFSTSNDKASQ